MGELRLVPAALTVWLASVCCLTLGMWPAFALAGVVALGLLACREVGQAILAGALGAVSAGVAAVRVAVAEAWRFSDPVVGTITGQPKLLDSGSWLIRIAVDGHPSTLAVFSQDLPQGAAPGAVVAASGQFKEATLPGVNPVVLSGRVDLVAEPTGYAAFAQHVRDTFAAAAARWVGPASEGLIPGMVLGDTSAQTAAEQQAYIDTGLSHLSAVSGSNVAYVTTAAAILATAFGLGLRARLAAAGAALFAFAAIVGPEPSVLRASVTGLVGLVAVLTSRRGEPIHLLCLAVIGLVLVDTDLAVHYGFALSVAATAGIVALSPLLYRVLAVTGWPDILVRAIAVAVAADVVTMPIVAAMAGRVSLVSATANVLVAPVTAPVTVLGLAAAGLSLAPGGLEAPLLKLIEPMTWWVHTVATTGAALPVATAAAGPATALVAYGWVIYGLLAKRPRVTGAVVVAVGVVTQFEPLPAPAVDQTTLTAHVVPTLEDIDPVPPGTQLIVVLETGSPTRRPTRTPAGIPVIFPNRDGPVTLRADGTRSP